MEGKDTRGEVVDEKEGCRKGKENERDKREELDGGWIQKKGEIEWVACGQKRRTEWLILQTKNWCGQLQRKRRNPGIRDDKNSVCL